MKARTRTLTGFVIWSMTVSLACCLSGQAVFSTSAFGEVGSPAEGSGASLLGGPLVVPAGLEEGEQARNAEQARLAGPEAVLAREESQTKFEGLDSGQAAKLAGEAFPEAIDHVAGALPPLPSGQRVVGYPADNVAQVDLGGGRHAVIESMEPVAIESSPGQRAPLDLSLGEANGAFQPLRSGVGVSIPKRLASGVRLAGTGVSLTPVDASGLALVGGEGVIDGATVLYANTQTDSDTVVKPLAMGFAEDTLLRSVNSPSRLSFQVGLPSGASLVPAKDGSGRVDVVEEGSVIAALGVPVAQDAEGTVVPVSTSTSGDTLTVSVDHRSGAYRYPIEVDPTVAEKGGYEGEILWHQTWNFFTENPSIFQAYQLETGKPGLQRYLKDVVSKSVAAEERAFFFYPTQGKSRIYAVTASTSFEGFAGSRMENVLGIENVHTGKPEVSQSWIENYVANPTLCTEAGCAPGTVTESNDKSEVFYQQTAREANEFAGGTSNFRTATVSIAQEAGPSTSFVPVEKWVRNETNSYLLLNASDPGLGIFSSQWTSPGAPEWKSGVYVFGCSGVQCNENEPLSGNLKGLPDGEDVIEATTKDPVGLSATSTTTVKIDNAAPYNLTLTGFPASHEISFGRYVVKVSATDGSGTTKSSGVASIALAIDGKEVGTPRGGCSPGPCTGTGEWSINGEEYAAGKHIFTMTATDGVGNVKKEEFPLTIESSESKGVGPGSVDLTSGAYTLEAADVAIASPGSGLTIRRSYNSRHLTAGAEGPLGPQWSGLGLGGTQSLAKLPTGSMLLTAANGRQAVFAKEGAKFVSPTGDANMTLTEEGTNTFILTEQNGTKTTFTMPSGGSGTLFTPSAREEPGTAGALKYTFQTVGGITEPTEALAPVPAGITCATLVKGCRALTFNYATSTTATGENESEWGDYAYRLTRIYFTGWDPSKSEMTTTTVAQYAYDRKGRLRAEWDPRVSPALKTTYGYDPEGHVVSLAAPGQETWAFTYTTIPSDPNMGRLLKAMQAPAPAALWNGQALASTAAPVLSGSPMVGNRMGVSNGAWSNGPVTYGYQWDRCSGSGAECVPIAEAVNPNYKPVEADIGHTLAAVVTAFNGDGSLTAMSSVSGLVSASGAPSYVSSTIGRPAGFKAPAGVAVTAGGSVWVTDTGDNQIVEFNKNDEFLKRIGSAGSGAGQFSGPRNVAVGVEQIWVADTGNNRIEEFNEKAYMAQFGTMGTGNGQFKEPGGVAVDSKGNVWVADTGNKRIQEFSGKREYQKQFPANGALARPVGITVDSSGNVWIATSGESSIQEFNEKGEFLQKFPKLGEGIIVAPQSIVVAGKHVWVADTENNRVQEFTEKGEFMQRFGTKGEGNGQLNLPGGIAVDSAGAVWVADTANNRIQQFTEKGEYLHQFTNQGTSGGEMSHPAGVAIGLGGSAWMVDEEMSRVNRFTENGTYLSQFGSKGEGNGQFAFPSGAAIDSKGDLWVADTSNQRIQEFNESGTYLSKFGSYGTGNGQFEYPGYVAVDAKGNVWVSDPGSHRVEEFNEKGEYVSKFGSEGTGNGQFKYGASGIALDSKGHIWVGDPGNNRVEEFTEKGEWLKTAGTSGKGNGQFENPRGLATDSAGNVWVVDSGNHRVEKLNEKGEYQTVFGMKGEGLGQFEEPRGIAIDAKGNVWVTDSGSHRAERWQIASTVEAEALPAAPGATVSYGVPVSGTGAPNSMSSTELEKWGQKDDPTEATAIFPPDEPQSTPASDYRRATIYYLDNHGRTVNVASPGGAIGTSEYNTTDDVVRTLSPDNRAAALKEGTKSAEASKLLDTQSTFNGEGTELQSTLGPQHSVKLATGATVEARDHRQYAYDEGAPTEGGPYRLVTKVTDGAQYSGKEEDVRTTATSYAGQENLGWKLRKPTSVTTDPGGLKLTHTILYEAATGNATEARTPASPGANSAHDTQTIYYTTAANPTYPGCGGHAEWANLPCQTQPAKQPETSGVPNLPVTTITYNIWDEPEKSTEAIGSTTRAKTATYDSAGRLKTSATTSSVGTALPTVTDEYNTETGALATQSTTTEGKTKKTTMVQNTLGQLTSYTDADENTSTYSYDIDGRPEKLSDGKGTQTYTYDTTTGFATSLADSAAGTFTGTYDVEGNLLTEGYPNGMNADYAYDKTGKPIGLEYIKTTHCTEKCTWFSDAIVPSIHGQWLSQASTLSNQSYVYDAAGRLSQVQNTPAGKGCTTRAYSYDEDTNRLSLTTREPGVKGECTTTGGAVEKHSYDTADRLTDTGAGYSTFGNLTTLPATDAGGSELTNAYYVDNQLASQTQNGQTIGYNLDPANRTRETVSTGKKVSDVISHYAGPGSTPAWTMNTSAEWTRNIPGLGGGLAAVQNNGETPVLQLTNLHGDLIATAYLSETATALASSADTSEFGIPTTSLPPKYSWLGANEIPTELPSGIVDMGARSYVPQLGRFLQPDPIPGGSANAYSYTFGDPVNASDPSGAYTVGGPSQALINGTQQSASEAAAEQAAINAAARAEAERKAQEATQALAAAAGPQYEGEEEEWEEWEEGEEGSYEYASNHPGQKSVGEETRIEPALLIQPLTSEEAGNGGGTTIPSSTVPLCKAGIEGPCTRDAGGFRGHCMNGNACKHRHHYTKTEIEQFEHGKCQTIGVGIAVAGYFLPEAKLAKAVLAGIGIGTSLSC
ncbi:MAG TPA: RHS repeat-associated core domain-containing protein [Solirubrobacteraceae bacterium]|jgi:RHS repeat-associated protein